MRGPGHDLEGDTGGHVRDGRLVEQGQPDVGPEVVRAVAVAGVRGAGAGEVGAGVGLGVAGGARDQRIACLGPLDRVQQGGGVAAGQFVRRLAVRGRSRFGEVHPGLARLVADPMEHMADLGRPVAVQEAAGGGAERVLAHGPGPPVRAVRLFEERQGPLEQPVRLALTFIRPVRPVSPVRAVRPVRTGQGQRVVVQCPGRPEPVGDLMEAA